MLWHSAFVFRSMKKLGISKLGATRRFDLNCKFWYSFFFDLKTNALCLLTNQSIVFRCYSSNLAIGIASSFKSSLETAIVSRNLQTNIVATMASGPCLQSWLCVHTFISFMHFILIFTFVFFFSNGIYEFMLHQA